jgi:DNA-binding phage protein
VLRFAQVHKNIFRKVIFMMNLEEIKARLIDANLKKVAEKAGIHEARVYRLMSGETEPMYETVKALSDYLEGRGTEQNREVV